jgi:hypothetical protein
MKKAFYTLILLFYCSLGLAQTNESIVSRQETPSVQKVKVFPNPATNVVNILGLKNSNKADIIISDVYGSVQLKHQWRIKNNALNIPIANLNSGIYIVTISSQEQQIQTKFYKK